MSTKLGGYSLQIRSARHAIFAWLTAGPLTPAFWIWLVYTLLHSPKFSTELSDWAGFGLLWLFTGLPSMIALSLGFALYGQLSIKTEANVSLVVLLASALTWVGATLFMIALYGSNDLYALGVILQIAISFGAIAALIMAVLSYALVRLIALKRVPHPTPPLASHGPATSHPHPRAQQSTGSSWPSHRRACAKTRRT